MKKTITVKKGERKTVVINQSGEWVFELVGEGAEVNIVGGFVGKKDEHIAIKTLQHHKAPHTKSNLLIKSVLKDTAQFSYDGLIKIDKTAQQSDAYQRNENLLLSDRAHVETKPELEILANDVRCTHGATIGYVDSEQLFYLLARGLSKKQATHLLAEGFLTPVMTNPLQSQLDML